jgi:glycerophosphoryl diester phosphodiesterase
MRTLDVQGHRGARGLKPENTLPAFEAALDLHVTTLECDLHLTKDDVPVVFHDDALDARLVRPISGAAVTALTDRPLVRKFTAAELREYRVDLNPDAKRFPKQEATPTPAAAAFARQQRFDPFHIPTLEVLFTFVHAYAGDLGKQTGKTETQRRRAAEVRFSLELKRVPAHPEYIGDGFDGSGPGKFEREVVAAIQKAGVTARSIIQSFDHRSVRWALQLEPKLTGAVLSANTAPISVVQITQAANAHIYSPDFQFLDAAQVRQAHDARIRVIPWTVNETEDMQRLIEYGVDGIITDYPDRLIAVLQARHIGF